MKLLSYTSRMQLFIFLLLFGVFSVVFYLILRWNVLQNVDEVLYNRKMELLVYMENNPDLPFTEHNPLDDFTINEIDQKSFQEGKEVYSDTLIYEPVDDELDEYRKLISHLQIHGNYYRLEILKPHLEANEIIGTIAITLSGLLLGLTICFYISQRMISRKLWNPFYELLEKLSHYRLDKENIPNLPDSRIEEFQMLNQAVTDMARKSKEVFESQKQFIENASHELQTPLSVIQSRLEALIGQAELTGKQASIIEGIIVSTQRIKKLNKTLLLLSKIENKQFLLNEKVDIIKIIDKSLEFFEEQKEALNLKISLEITDCLIIQGNVLLSETLIQNLLKNAFMHNIQKGSISIACDRQKLTISNTGRSLPIDQDKIFSRFYKKSDNPETWGLGLAIAYKITQTSGWSLKYTKQSDQHIFEVLF